MAQGPYCRTCDWYEHKKWNGWAIACAKHLCNPGIDIDTQDGCKGMNRIVLCWNVRLRYVS